MSRKKLPAILGTFGKGVAGSVSINFGVSGGRNCDPGCALHPASESDRAEDERCYAATLEKRGDRKNLARKLERHQEMPAALVCGAALVELQRLELLEAMPPWVRISTNGSVPQVADWEPLFMAQFVALLQWLADREIPVHLPIETAMKAKAYRQLVAGLVVVRESCEHNHPRFVRAAGPVAAVAGRAGTTYAERIAAARKLAERRRRRSGRKVIVCPAILRNWAEWGKPKRSGRAAKCGHCTACAAAGVDVVYPYHK